MNSDRNIWLRLPAGARLSILIGATVAAVTGIAFGIGVTSGDDAPDTQPEVTFPAPAVSIVPPPATRISAKPLPSDGDVTAAAPSPTAQPGPIREAGVTFVAAWLNTSGTPEAWRGRLTVSEIGSFRPRYVTPELKATILDKDAPMDPETVPTGVIGRTPAVVTLVADGIADVAVPVISDVIDRQNPQMLGTVTVTLVERDGRWLVSEIDWSPV